MINSHFFSAPGNIILISTSLLLLSEIRDQQQPSNTYQMTKIPKATHWGLSISIGRASSSSSSGRTGTSDITVVRRLIWSRKQIDDKSIEDSCGRTADRGIFRRPLQLIGTIHKMIRASWRRHRQIEVVTWQTRCHRNNWIVNYFDCVLTNVMFSSRSPVQILYPADGAIHFSLW